MVTKLKCGVLAVALAVCGFAQTVEVPADIRTVPPRGWNSWDGYGAAATESDVMVNADAMAKYLLPHGYTYCVLDIRWTLQNENLDRVYNQRNPIYTLDGYGRYLPAPNRFPSSVADGPSRGLRALADYVHAKGLKFGIHIMRGVPKEAVRRKLPVKGAPGVTCDMIVKGPNPECPWLRDNLTVDATKPGAQAYYDSIVALYVEWGVDFIKCDDLSQPYHADEIELLAKAIAKCGRPIVFSTSPGPTPTSAADHVRRQANMWRLVNDVWDTWGHFIRLVPVVEAWCQVADWGEGRWPDCDMLPFGTLCLKGASRRIQRDRLTPAERRSFMTLWCICRSPLMFAGVCPDLAYQRDVLELLTDPLCLEANAKGRNPRVVRRSADEMVMESLAPEGGRYVALFNLSSAVRTVAYGEATAELPPHGARLLKVRCAKQTREPIFWRTFDGDLANHGTDRIAQSGISLPKGDGKVDGNGESLPPTFVATDTGKGIASCAPWYHGTVNLGLEFTLAVRCRCAARPRQIVANLGQMRTDGQSLILATEGVNAVRLAVVSGADPKVTEEVVVPVKDATKFHTYVLRHGANDRVTVEVDGARMPQTIRYHHGNGCLQILAGFDKQNLLRAYANGLNDPANAVDDVRVYDRLLADAESKALAAGPNN